MSVQSSISAIDLFVLLALAHFVCDFGLQTDRMAVEKVAGSDRTLNWRWWLTTCLLYTSDAADE